MKHLVAFLFLLLMPRVAYTGVGDIDEREYVSWDSPEYNKIVYFKTDTGGTCTAEYIANDIIITARHCITHNPKFDKYEKIGTGYTIKLSDGRTTSVVLEEYGSDFKNGDWALLRVQDKAFYKDIHFSVANKTPKITVQSAGFGFLPILTNDQIKAIKEIFIRDKDKYKTGQFVDQLASNKQEIKKIGVSSLYDLDENGDLRLKSHKNCRIADKKGWSKATFFTTCDLIQGDSGGPFFSNNVLYGIVSGGISSFDDKTNVGYGVRTENFIKAIAKMQKTSASQDIKTVNTKSATESVVEQGQSRFIEEKIKTAEQELGRDVANVNNMSDKDFLRFLGRVADFEQLHGEYERARTREQSLANRLLGAAAIGAGGIGGTMVGAALAEKRADENAERTMQAYLETMRCEYADGKSVRGGETNVELPGGNDMIALYTQYAQLANDLKSRKEMLGVAPGIESAVVIDKSDTGLYDDAGVGIVGGGYASIARAIMDPDGADAKAWAAQRAKTESNLKTGGIVAGVGAVGGMVGNIAINGPDGTGWDKDNKNIK